MQFICYNTRMKSKRPVIDYSNTIKPCRYLDQPDSDRLTTITADPTDKENPCKSICDSIPVSIAIGLVTEAVCLLQRECEVCPRGLGIEVDPRLVPLNRRK